MPDLISYCGLTCQTCPVYSATRQEDKAVQAQMRADIARLCREHYGVNYEPDDINDCDGCRAEGRLFFGCKDCDVRECARKRKVENCAHCPDYVCSRLDLLFDRDPEAKTHLDAVREQILKAALNSGAHY